MAFSKELGLNIHKGKMHSENKRKHIDTETNTFTCEVCKYVGVSNQELENHNSIMHSEPRFKCDICNFTGVSLEEVKKHYTLIHEESKTQKLHVELRKDKTKCPLCDYSNDEECDLKRHIRDDPETSPKAPRIHP